MSLDTTFWVASFTKILTSVSCMQLVERGIFVLDDADQVESLCPELRDIKVLCKNKAGSFDLVEKKRRITLRMLLNHTGTGERTNFNTATSTSQANQGIS